MRRKNAFGRDSQAGVHGDQEHYVWYLLTHSAYDNCVVVLNAGPNPFLL
jgi:hypothetical protein